VFKVPTGQLLTTLAIKGENKDVKVLDVRDPATRVVALETQVDQAWATSDWPVAITALTTLHTVVPGSVTFKDKLYAAYINNADKFTTAGDKKQAATQLDKAVQLDNGRDEAKDRQIALTPAPPTPVVLPKVGDAAQSGSWGIGLGKVETAKSLGTQFSRSQAQGIFVVLTVAAKNLHNETSTLNSFDFQMLGGPTGTTYKVSNDGSTALLGTEPEVLWLSAQIQPGLIKSFRLVFDVNPEVKSYVFEAAKIKFAVDLP
jgi:hypothetical protein